MLVSDEADWVCCDYILNSPTSSASCRFVKDFAVCLEVGNAEVGAQIAWAIIVARMTEMTLKPSIVMW